MELGQTYHIFNHANGSELLFREHENYRFFLGKFKKYIPPVADTYAYCLMPNHFHFLLRIKPEEELADLSGFQNLTGLTAYEKQVSKCFSNLFNSYSKAYNKRFERRGSLFERRFKWTMIESTTQWQETFHYIHLNPIKHRFVRNASSWYWNSWRAYKNRGKYSLLKRDVAIEQFDNIENLLFCSEEKREKILNLQME